MDQEGKKELVRSRGCGEEKGAMRCKHSSEQGSAHPSMGSRRKTS